MRKPQVTRRQYYSRHSLNKTTQRDHGQGYIVALSYLLAVAVLAFALFLFPVKKVNTPAKVATKGEQAHVLPDAPALSYGWEPGVEMAGE